MKHPLAGLRSALLFSALAVAGFAASAPSPTRAPNIVFILADDLGYGDVKCLNPQGKIATPQLDRLAAGGMVFTEAHSSSAVCTPSRYSILTGRYAWRSALKSSVLGGFSPRLIEEGRLTVAEFLRSQGYATAMVGKWHLGLEWAKRPPGEARVAGDEKAATKAKAKATKAENENLGRDLDFTKPFGRGPVTLGFDEFFGISASLDMPPYTFLENDRVTVVPTKEQSFPWVGSAAAGKQTRVGPTAEGFDVVDVLPAFTQRAIDVIGRRAAAAREGRPFFLYLPLNSPHTPLAPTPEWRGKSGLNDYADFVMQTDAAVGEVLAALEKNGVADNTLVIFTSDNGCSPEADYPFLNAHAHDPSAARRGAKADIYDGGHHIPLIVRWPGRVTAGKSSDGFVCLGDFMATCADVLGAKLPDTAAEDSVSFLPLLAGRTVAAPRETLVLHSINGSFGIRQGKWKLELCADSGGWSFPRPGKDDTTGMPRFQLFDLEKDPAEKTNVLAENPEVVRRLGRLLREQVVNGRSTPGAPQPNTPAARWPQLAVFDEFK
ncbi:MAG: arylsulfatase [Verrucomicrobia bacterium]|nr:arylsulfatase [Verrucomicrobiota bacterium]